ncbi:MAG: hypothetical protein HQL41_14650 [Alphaproteobacteria bacterium]|nr:hypothetical protein [Alphaproteobacteria bacterium]
MSEGVADLSAGAQIRLRHGPSRIGVTTGRDRMQRDRRLVQVRFPDPTTYAPEDQLEAVLRAKRAPLICWLMGAWASLSIFGEC